MRALVLARRAQVWRSHIAIYIDAHPGLSGSAMIALEAARSGLTAATLSDPSIADRQSLQATADQIEALLGKDEAWHVAYQLGAPAIGCDGASPDCRQLRDTPSARRSLRPRTGP